ncbi:apolipoprotein C-I isoform X3 [Marmota marmota marmota]|uniref:apolipoprotein C-I isoform X3 n=1 Tax=Marmota marmota marmota TaxID=9994 RepID=UPI00209227E0|nr:apolipoprotein C-I isoform X3 [Marmota marmota marmota]
MRPLLALSVLVVVLSVVLEGPAPAQAAPDVSSTFEQIPGKLKEFGNTLEDKTREVINHIKNSDFATKTRRSKERLLVMGTGGDNKHL